MFLRNFPETKLIYLIPYSPMLNPIEISWSVMKSEIKKKFAKVKYFNDGYPSQEFPQVEWAAKATQRTKNDSYIKFTPEMCQRFISHMQTLFSDAIQLNDM
ncbi:hypothetical protein AYI68_g1650 [Smittium mucronatum]|uniref:Tc1-like transposase DDE domain-containing protein n=1 Tax=Smittium mucronatum TaxID=133383 RepID=A0A1R0H512_9FUNG|nr:hypothetical protein AYI68_g1650 [Smittium mucronatum]